MSARQSLVSSALIIAGAKLLKTSTIIASAQKQLLRHLECNAFLVELECLEEISVNCVVHEFHEFLFSVTLDDLIQFGLR